MRQKKKANSLIALIGQIVLYALLFGGGLALSLYGGLVLFQLYLISDTVEVPDLLNQDLTRALNRAVELGLYLEVLRVDQDPFSPPSAILEQKPDPGSLVKKGQKIKVVINGTAVAGGTPSETSSTVQSAVVPEVKDIPLEEARRILSEEGFRVGNVSSVSHEQVPRNWVISQNPPAGSTLPQGETVHLLVSKGASETPVSSSILVPDLVGLKLEEAERLLRGEGLMVGEIREEVVPGRIPGIVVSQNPPPQTTVSPGEKVNLVVAQRVEDLKEVRLRFVLPETKDPITVRVEVEDELGKRTAYEEKHPGGETVELFTPTKGKGRVVIYLNNYYYWEKELD